MTATDRVWLPRDVVTVVQAARNLTDQPMYAERLWAQCEDPMRAALYLIDLLMRERTGAGVTEAEAEAEAYQAGYGDGLEDAQNPELDR